MLRSDPYDGRRSRRGRVTTVVLAAALAIVTAGCADSDTPPPEPARPTPIAKLDTSAMVIPRIAFCDLVGTQAAADALGGDVADTDEWGAGDRTEGASGPVDGAQEFGCAWSADDGSTARAWVFAAPVSRQVARKVLWEAAAKKGCRTPEGPDFGSPSQVQVCTLEGGVTRVRHAGLFGDAWLTCEVASPSAGPKVLRQRTGSWCVQVANALDTSG